MRMRAWCVILLAIVGGGCDRESGAPAGPASKRAAEPAVEIQDVTPLLPDRRTHVSATGTGQIFWVQEAPERGGRETVFTMAEGGLPSATRFSNQAVLEALGEKTGRGGIQSLVAGPGGDLYFYFAGESRWKLLHALGVFSPSRGETRILAGESELGTSSGMGKALSLTRASVVRAPDGRTWLWLRHDLGYVLLSVDPDESGATLRRPFERVRGPGDDNVQLISQGEDLSAAGDGLVYLDRRKGRLLRIDGSGQASVLADVSDLPRTLTAPSADERGRLAMFAPDAPPLAEPPDNPLAEAPKVADLPAWVTLDGSRRTILGRGSLVAPGKVNLRALAFPQLFRDRSSWLGYDAQTGALLRLRVVER